VEGTRAGNDLRSSEAGVGRPEGADKKRPAFAASEIEPFRHWILIRRDEELAETESGFIIPEKAREKPTTGEVLAVGHLVQHLEPGQRIVIGKWDGNDMTCQDGASVSLVQPDDIIALINDATD
jgi:chaperonin GroES